MPDKKHLDINNIHIKVGQIITKYLNGATNFAVFIGTAGEKFDQYLEQLKADGDIVSEFLVYSIGSEIAEATIRFIAQEINQKALQMGLSTTASYSPGHCSWHVREQQQLFLLLPEKPCGVKLNESSLMHPVKSVSGIIGMGANIEQTPTSCDICGMTTCFKRKTSC
jgi:cobalamin-dependent methionine synthase I